VLVGVGAQEVIVHDLRRGPNLGLSLADLIELWRPLGRSEIGGNVLVVVSKGRPAPTRCPRCDGALPDIVVCPTCREPFPLHPSAFLGCMDTSCPERTSR
jgi:hypothetical protein